MTATLHTPDTQAHRAVTVYCASSPQAPARFVELAREVGRLAAMAGLGTVTGAGSAGLMGAVVDGTLSAGGMAIGVIPQFMVERGWCNPRMTRCHVTPDMGTRKDKLAELGCGAIALPGGLGTLDELMDLLTRCQLGLYTRPVVILNHGGFYDSLLAQFEQADGCGMMRHTGLPARFWHVAVTAAEAIDIILRSIR